MPNLKNIITGAAVGTFLGSLSVALYPKHRKLIETVADRAKEYADELLTKGKSLTLRRVDNNGWLNGLGGGLAGMILGAGATMLLTPITGKQMRSQIRKTYNEMYENAKETAHTLQDYDRPNIYRKAARSQRSIRRKIGARTRTSARTRARA